MQQDKSELNRSVTAPGSKRRQRYYRFSIRGVRYGRAISEPRTKRRAVDGGAPVSAVKEVMGHVDIGTTMRYVYATDDGKRRAVDAAVRRGKENLPQRLEKKDSLSQARK